MNILSTFLTGSAAEAGIASGRDLYNVISEQLGRKKQGDLLLRFSQDPLEPSTQAAMISALFRELNSDNRFRSDVINAAGTHKNLVQPDQTATTIGSGAATNNNAGRDAITAGRDLKIRHKTVTIGGVRVPIVVAAVVAAGVVLIMLLDVIGGLAGVIGGKAGASSASQSQMTGVTTCREWLAADSNT